MSGRLPLGNNYVVFSPDFIAPDPPEVAIAVEGRKEKWSDKKLEAMTVGKANAVTGASRGLRTENPAYPHRHIRFDLPVDEALAWRGALIAALMAKRRDKRRDRAPTYETALRVKC